MALVFVMTVEIMKAVVVVVIILMVMGELVVI